MGLFWEKRKIKEEKEDQMLSAILKQFESEIVQGQDQKKSVKGEASPVSIPKPGEFQKAVSPLNKSASVEDLALFLASKGLFEHKEWEDFQTKKNG